MHKDKKWVPGADDLRALDAQIDASEDVPPERKTNDRGLLRLMFETGNRLRALGVEEAFIRSKLPMKATDLKIGQWPGVVDVTDAIFKLAQRQGKVAAAK